MRTLALHTEILWACEALRLLKKQLFRNTFVSATRPPAHAVTIQLKNLCHQLLYSVSWGTFKIDVFLVLDKQKIV